MEPNEKENNIDETHSSEDSESTNNPSVVEFLGSEWKEHFIKTETIEEILRQVVWQRDFRNFAKHRSSKKGRAPVFNYDILYKYVSINSIAHLGENRQIVTALLQDIKSGGIEKWSLDITSTTPQLDQIFRALYCSDNDCAGEVIVYCRDLLDSNESDPEINVEKDAVSNVLSDIFQFTDRIYSVHARIDSLPEEDNIGVVFRSFPISLGSDRRRKIPSRSIFENSIWDSYYSRFRYASAWKERCKSKLITDSYFPYVKIPFLVEPKWSAKGLFMRLYAVHDCPETEWLIKSKKDELARRYPGHEIKVGGETGMAYLIDIQLHDVAVKDFIESSARAKFNYALEVREQHLELMGHIEDIFRDYVPKSK